MNNNVSTFLSVTLVLSQHVCLTKSKALLKSRVERECNIRLRLEHAWKFMGLNLLSVTVGSLTMFIFNHIKSLAKVKGEQPNIDLRLECGLSPSPLMSLPPLFIPSSVLE